jgi:hypothetical protein
MLTPAEATELTREILAATKFFQKLIERDRRRGKPKGGGRSK